jgi:hypothetical protein
MAGHRAWILCADSYIMPLLAVDLNCLPEPFSFAPRLGWGVEFLPPPYLSLCKGEGIDACGLLELLFFGNFVPVSGGIFS